MPEVGFPCIFLPQGGPPMKRKRLLAEAELDKAALKDLVPGKW
jgi:hypothetical protein